MRVRLPALLRRASLVAANLIALSHAAAVSEPADTPGLNQALGRLFFLTADHGTTADHAASRDAEPTFESEVSVIPDGVRGPALRCGNLQRLAWRAPGNIRAQRGTISFFWRAHTPVGPTEFPIFRVAFADHSSWDMVFLRLDYNGHGFDGFVTDTGLARVRVSATVAPFPRPDEWIHVAFAWDETVGVRLYVNGQLAAAKDQRAVLDAGLDQFGPHSRIISPHQVQSDYNFVRGGDLDELSIYDRMLDADAVAALARFANPPLPSPAVSSPADTPRREAWLHRHGWDKTDRLPPPLPGEFTTVRKVEIHDAYDLKRWYWKANDGIRETTWPGVYNRSRLAGRNDYFQLPDWDCYVGSGQSVTFTLPDEPWNHLEISGPAWGRLTTVSTALDNESEPGTPLAERPRGQEKTVHRFATDHRGGFVRFTNVEQETPIEEFAAYRVSQGREPAGAPTLAYRVRRSALGTADNLRDYILGRHPAEESASAAAIPLGAAEALPAPAPSGGMPLLHVLIPASNNDSAYDLAKIDGALDGIALDLPALDAAGPVALNVRIKDPLWPARDLADFSFTVGPNEPRTVWFDLRDRILPPGKALYLTIAASAGVSPDDLAPVLRLVFKPRAAGLAEHVADRFTQARDAYAMLVEEHPYSPKLDLWVRFESDLRDLLRVAPDHVLGQQYAATAFRDHPKPAFKLPDPPAGTPRWALLQSELMQRVDDFVNWYIDRRQSAFGDFGGGISDDTDLLNLWPAAAALGIDPEKLRASNSRLLEASFANGMWSHGFSAIQTDELHSYEEGINALGEMLILSPGSPRELERAMETARGLERLTGVNAAGHRHIRSTYFSGDKLATDGVWGWSKAYSYLVLQPAQLLVDFNGQPRARKLLVELADGLLAHRRAGENGRAELPSAIEFATDAEARATRNWFPWPLFWNAWQWSGDRRYLDPVFDGGVPTIASLNPNVLDLLDLRESWGERILRGEEGRAPDGRPTARSNRYRGAAGYGHLEWQLTRDKRPLEKLYAAQLEEIALTNYINTEGSLWIDRVGIPNIELQRARLGGVALARNSTFPGHVVSWTFAAPARARSVAVLIPDATATAFTVFVHNLDDRFVQATLTGAAVTPGRWSVVQGVDANGDDAADGPVQTHEKPFGRAESLSFDFPPHVTSVLRFKLVQAGTPCWERPDLGLDPQDVVRSADGRSVQVRVHSLGSVAAPATRVIVRGADGRVLADATTPALPAPLDLEPKTAVVELPLAEGAALTGAGVEIDPDGALEEITRRNNRAPVPAR